MMAEFWPTKEAFKQDPETSEIMNDHLKIVFSTTLQKSDWKHTVFLNGNVCNEIGKLKAQPGKNVFVFGSANLCKTLLENSWIDKYRIMVNPVVLGSGISFFDQKVALQLLKTRPFGNGNMYC